MVKLKVKKPKVTVKKPKVTLKKPKVVMKPPKVTIGGGNGKKKESTADAVPRCVVENDPNPPQPSPFCHVPKRLRNTESFPVVVKYTRTFRNDGPSHLCNPTPHVESLEVRLTAGQSMYLGCSRYQTTNMLCAEVRAWQIVSVVRG